MRKGCASVRKERREREREIDGGGEGRGGRGRGGERGGGEERWLLLSSLVSNPATSSPPPGIFFPSHPQNHSQKNQFTHSTPLHTPLKKFVRVGHIFFPIRAEFFCFWIRTWESNPLLKGKITNEGCTRKTTQIKKYNQPKL